MFDPQVHRLWWPRCQVCYRSTHEAGSDSRTSLRVPHQDMLCPKVQGDTMRRVIFLFSKSSDPAVVKITSGRVNHFATCPDPNQRDIQSGCGRSAASPPSLVLRRRCFPENRWTSAPSATFEIFVSCILPNVMFCTGNRPQLNFGMEATCLMELCF